MRGSLAVRLVLVMLLAASVAGCSDYAAPGDPVNASSGATGNPSGAAGPSRTGGALSGEAASSAPANPDATTTGASIPLPVLKTNDAWKFRDTLQGRTIDRSVRVTGTQMLDSGGERIHTYRVVDTVGTSNVTQFYAVDDMAIVQRIDQVTNDAGSVTTTITYDAPCRTLAYPLFAGKEWAWHCTGTKEVSMPGVAVQSTTFVFNGTGRGLGFESARVSSGLFDALRYELEQEYTETGRPVHSVVTQGLAAEIACTTIAMFDANNQRLTDLTELAACEGTRTAPA